MCCKSSQEDLQALDDTVRPFFQLADEGVFPGFKGLLVLGWPVFFFFMLLQRSARLLEQGPQFDGLFQCLGDGFSQGNPIGLILLLCGEFLPGDRILILVVEGGNPVIQGRDGFGQRLLFLFKDGFLVPNILFEPGGQGCQGLNRSLEAVDASISIFDVFFGSVILLDKIIQSLGIMILIT